MHNMKQTKVYEHHNRDQKFYSICRRTHVRKDTTLPYVVHRTGELPAV